LEEIMQTLTAADLPSSFPQVRPHQKQESHRAALPSSFQEALLLGWSIVKEESSIAINSKRRSGVFLLRSRKSPMRLRIPYAVTAKDWRFGKPEPITVD
jgi:hypothetical protein